MKHSRTLFLAFDIFNKTGGIQKVCRTLCYTLNSILENKGIDKLRIHSCNDIDPDCRYIPNHRFKGFCGHRFAFSYTTFFHGITANKIVASHLHLVPLLVIIKLINWHCSITIIAHGTEFWRKLNPLTRYFIRNHVDLWAVSEFTKKTIIRRHAVQPHRIHTVHNCLDPYYESPRTFEKPAALLRRYSLDISQPVLFTLCRINCEERLKGYQIIVDTIPQLLKTYPNLHYIIGGNITEEEKSWLISKISHLQITPHVTITGFITEDELPLHYLLADVFIMPSKKEGFGLVFMEAISYGCSTIAGNQDGSAEALINGKIGHLVNPDSKKEITNVLVKVLGDKRRKQRNLQNQRACIDHFSSKKYQEKIACLLQ